MTITVHLGGHPEIWRLIGCRGPQDQATPEREGLGGGVRTGKRLQLGPFLVGSRHWGSIRDWHERKPPLGSGTTERFFL